MAEVLLRELSNTDIDWMIATGRREQIAAGTVLIQPDKNPDAIYLLLDGALALVVPQAEPAAVGDASDGSGKGECGDREVAQLSRGEIVGENSLLNLCSMPGIIKAVDNSLVLSIPRQQLVAKLQQDITFSAHFYKAIALLLSERLRQMLEMPGQIRFAGDQPIKEALFVFGELWDSDIDWLVAVGKIERLAPGDFLIQAGKPIDAVYAVLDGLLSIAVPEGDFNPLTFCFECPENASFHKSIANLSRGEMSGLVSFLDFRLPPMTVRAIRESLVLAIPRSQLSTKLQQDMGFASRFHRVLAIQLSNSLEMVMDRLGCDQQSYNQDQAMGEDVEYDDELDMDDLHQVSQGAAKFNWMLKRLGVV